MQRPEILHNCPSIRVFLSAPVSAMSERDSDVGIRRTVAIVKEEDIITHIAVYTLQTATVEDNAASISYHSIPGLSFLLMPCMEMSLM
jgi:hypothetical protein